MLRWPPRPKNKIFGVHSSAPDAWHGTVTGPVHSVGVTHFDTPFVYNTQKKNLVWRFVPLESTVVVCLPFAPSKRVMSLSPTQVIQAVVHSCYKHNTARNTIMIWSVVGFFLFVPLAMVVGHFIKDQIAKTIDGWFKQRVQTISSPIIVNAYRTDLTRKLMRFTCDTTGARRQ